MKKVALVTGASRGIGRAIAIDLAQNGYNVAINYAGNERAAIEVKETIEAIGIEVIVLKADVSNLDQCEEMIKQVNEKWGRIDVLVNNAGITRDTLLMRMKEEDWDQVITTNLKGVFNCTKAVSRLMLKQKVGKIVNITSVVGVTGNAGQSNYAAAKAGVIGFTKSTAKEFASRGITVNAVAPGYIVTDMTDKLPDNLKEEIKKEIPLNRLGGPEDVAQVVSFLVSKSADYITGQVICVDGGMVM